MKFLVGKRTANLKDNVASALEQVRKMVNDTKLSSLYGKESKENGRTGYAVVALFEPFPPEEVKASEEESLKTDFKREWDQTFEVESLSKKE